MSIPGASSDHSTIGAFIETIQLALPESAETALVYMDSSPLMQLSAATLKNLPFLSAAKEFSADDICHAVSSRVNYFEVALISVASLIYTVASTFFYTAFVVLTFGQSENLNFSCRKSWTHLLHSGMGFGIGLVGALAPSLGGYFNRVIGQGMLNALKVGYQNDLKLFEKNLVSRIKDFYNEHKDKVVKFLIESHPDLFHDDYDPFFETLSRSINAAESVEDLQEAAILAWDKFSRGKTEAPDQVETTVSGNESLDMSNRDWSKLYQFIGQLNAEAWKKLPESTQKITLMLNSTSMVQLTSATVKNLPYITASGSFGINDIFHMFSTRFHYLEAALISFASAIHNVAMFVFYTGLVFITMGQSEGLNFSWKMHFVHIIHSATAVGIGVCGTLLPSFGVLLNYLVLTTRKPGTSFRKLDRSFLISIAESYQKDLELYADQLLQALKEIYRENHPIISKFGKEWFDTYLRAEFDPFLRYLDTKILDAGNMEDLALLAIEIWRKFPRVHLPVGARHIDSASGSRPKVAMHQHYI